MHYHAPSMMLLMWVCVLTWPAFSARAIAPDAQALLDFKSTLTKAEILSTSWNSTNVDATGCPHQWYGVRALSTNMGCQVVELQLPASGLIGTISPNLAGLKSLVNLSLAQNALTGEISTLLKLPQLARLFLNDNALSGSVRFEPYSRLMVVDLSDNRLSGPILPPFPESLSHVDFSGNAFAGAVPQELGQATGLRLLDLSRNKLSGPIPAMPLLVSLSVLRLSDNSLTGQIPAELLNEQTPQLQEVDLSRNRLTGSLGPVTTKVMNILRLASNQLTGSLPSKIQSCRVVDLSNNQFSGGIALSKWSPNLRTLDLSHNNLSGVIDNSSLMQLFVLTSLNLSSNQLSGGIPSQLLTSPSLTELVLSHNQFQGAIPEGGGSYPLRVLDLSQNDLSGVIPRRMGSSYKELLVLTLRENELEGTIPGDFSSLQDLDVSQNLLSGAIPQHLSGSLKHLNVSGNNLSGEVPEYLALFPRSSFYPGNPSLLFPLHAPSSPFVPAPAGVFIHHDGMNTAMRIGLIVGITLVAALGAVMCMLMFYFRAKGRPARNDPKPVEEADASSAASSVKGALAPPKARSDIKRDALDLKIESPMRTKWDGSVSAEHPMVLKVKSPDRLAGDLFFLDATFLFTAEELSRAPAEVLGRSNHGTSYKATLDNGHVLTVKWLREGLARNKKEFTREAKRFGGIKHPNVISLRGYYWGPREHEKLLLSDFISTGSLAQHLYEKTGRRHPPLTWEQRLQIAIGVANGLSYLHNKHGVAHGNLKATNVLLQGPELTARISDYSLHRLMTVAGTANQILNAGSLGYRSPELAATRKPKPSLVADVYALGMILLELLTGKGAGDIMSANSGAVDLLEWVRLVVKESRPVDCFDTTLRTQGECPKSMHEVLGLALSCMNPQATRPSVKCILDQLVALADDA